MDPSSVKETHQMQQPTGDQSPWQSFQQNDSYNPWPNWQADQQPMQQSPPPSVGQTTPRPLFIIALAISTVLFIGLTALLFNSYMHNDLFNSVANPTPPVLPSPTGSSLSTATSTALVQQTTPTQNADPSPTPYAQPTKPLCGISCNPWGYSFKPGSLIYIPPSDFCNYFPCITNFWEADDPGDGY